MALLQPPSNLKLCTTCIHSYGATVKGRYLRVCRHPSNITGWSLVDGLPILRMATCQDERYNPLGNCNMDGVNHETRGAVAQADSKLTLARLKNISADDL